VRQDAKNELGNRVFETTGINENNWLGNITDKTDNVRINATYLHARATNVADEYQ